ncbi:AAA domain-containing protein [Actinomadura syzygii]|uniref:Protein kinase domain-containing protein n=1 Tax=Actinomadura syzygii TaxID=1427538 RepID=A0A5D0U9F2_9ACTN|nr:AAA domain-containing protein [Actinomadura syzygii]TYC14336.1 hypothetical protein FXF65_15840 [Actinomadura syzygii]
MAKIDDEPSGIDPQEIDRLVMHFFGAATVGRESYRPAGGKPIEAAREEIIKGTLYRYGLVDGSSRPVILQIYCGVSKIGGDFWNQEVRVLMRAAALRHPALPTILGGGYKEPEATTPIAPGVDGFAYVVTKGAIHNLAMPELRKALRVERMLAVRQFYILADGLAQLHSLGIVHRNLWAGTVEVDHDPETNTPRFRLSRFEMSRMVADMLRATPSNQSAAEERTRRIIKLQDPRALTYCPPERLRYLFAGENAGNADVGDTRSDVFGLGMLVYEWFADDLPSAITGPPGDAAPEEIIKAVTEIHDGLRGRLASGGDLAKTLPDQLRELLGDMLNPLPHLRPEAGEVVTKLNECFEQLTNSLAGPQSDKPYLIAFIPHEYQRPMWSGWLGENPNSAEGREKLAAFIERDLRGATLIYAPHGAEPYIRAGQAKAQRESRQMLKGQTHAWFCRPFKAWNPIGSAHGPGLDDVLIITFAVPLESLHGKSADRAVARAHADRAIPQVKAVAYDIDPQELAECRTGRPKWSTLIDALTPPLAGEPEELLFEQALDWLLRYQGIELRAREYPYEVAEQGATTATLRLDHARDDRRRHSDGLTRRFYGQLRPSFGDFFARMVNDEAANEIDVIADNDGQPDHGHRLGKVSVTEQHGDDAIIVRHASSGLELPAKGWLRPAGDGGSHVSLRRQTDARWELLDNKVLLSQLRRPSTIRGLPGRWKDAVADIEPTTFDADDVVLDLLVCEPFSAVQGPPGTGKTEVAARALTAFLRMEEGARVLVSAQSNYALDNLALRILQRMGVIDKRHRPTGTDRVVALRVTTNAGEARVDERMKPFTLGKLTERIRDALYDHASTDSEVDDDNEWRAFLKQRWLPVVEECGPELADRLLRGAGMVFATCAAAVPQFVASDESSAMFDWVLVEEAAKAWPTELAIPLSCGLRWTLIGDHHQLPAHRRREVLRFIDDSHTDEDDDVAIHGARSAEYRRVFDLFGSLFDTDTTTGDVDDAHLERPLQVLSRQFRMNEPIKEVVSRVFYPRGEARDSGGLREGLLVTGKRYEPHGLTAPEPLAGQSLVWLDTHGLPQCADELAWANPGEVDVVASLVGQLRPKPAVGKHGFGEEPMAILTPYRRQADLLRGRTDLTKHVYTIHSFQGKEADIVVVSLVRDTQRGDGAHPWRSIGHLDQRELVNVMFSRARRLLVVVGNFGHFRDSGSPFWKDVCIGVERFGTVLPAKAVVAP